MNIKLHTPKSLKMGSGMASMKQIPMLGTFYSHVGNVLFPCWEHFIPMSGTFSCSGKS